MNNEYKKRGQKRDGKNPLKQIPYCNKLTLFCKRLNFRNVTWHVFRHTFASQLAQNGVQIQVIKELLGHTDIKTTMRYAHLNQSNLQEAVASFNRKKEVVENFGQQMGTSLPFTFLITQNCNRKNSELIPNIRQNSVE